MMQRTFTAQCLVLRRTKVGESDLLITLLSSEQGKFASRVNGVRRLHSKKRGALEPGNVVNAYFVNTKSLPLLTQATAISDCSTLSNTLMQFRQLSLFLELCDKLFVETAFDPTMYDQVLSMRSSIVENRASNKSLQVAFGNIIAQLGYQHPTESKYANITDYVSALSDKPVKSYNYLSVSHSS